MVFRLDVEPGAEIRITRSPFQNSHMNEGRAISRACIQVVSQYPGRRLRPVSIIEEKVEIGRWEPQVVAF